MEGEPTASRTELALNKRLRDSRAIYENTCLQTCLNAQNQPGLRKDLLPHPFGQYVEGVWRKGSQGVHF